MGAASVSATRPLAATPARSALRAAKGTRRLLPLTSETLTCVALPFHGSQGGLRLPPLSGGSNGRVDLPYLPVEIGDPPGRYLDPGVDVGALHLDSRLCRTTFPDMRGHVLGIDARRVDDGEPGDQDDQNAAPYPGDCPPASR